MNESKIKPIGCYGTLWEEVEQQQQSEPRVKFPIGLTASARIVKGTVKSPVKVFRPKLITAMRCDARLTTFNRYVTAAAVCLQPA